MLTQRALEADTFILQVSKKHSFKIHEKVCFGLLADYCGK